MIYYLCGILSEITNEHIIVEANGIGYQVFIPTTVLNALPSTGETVKIFTHHHIREDLQILYGFSSLQEKNIFSILTSVSGVGPKVGIKMLSTFSADRLTEAILRDDLTTLTSISGVGKKMAERIVIELKDKLSKIFHKDINLSSKLTSLSSHENLKQDISKALKNLGYREEEIKRGFLSAREILTPDTTVEEGIKALLKNL